MLYLKRVNTWLRSVYRCFNSLHVSVGQIAVPAADVAEGVMVGSESFVFVQIYINIDRVPAVACHDRFSVFRRELDAVNINVIHIINSFI